VRLDTLMGYGLLGTIGVSASTIASAIVGKPFPVVVPILFAGIAVAAHHVRTKDSGDDQIDEPATDGPDASPDTTITADGDPLEGSA